LTLLRRIQGSGIGLETAVFWACAGGLAVLVLPGHTELAAGALLIASNPCFRSCYFGLRRGALRELAPQKE